MIVWLFAGCGDAGPDKDPDVIIPVGDGDADVTEADSGKQTADISLCGVVVTFTLRYGEGVQIAFDNQNDTTVIVRVGNDTTGALVVQDCLWAGKQSQQEAAFAAGDTLVVEVRQGQGQFWHWLCAEFTDEVLNNFPVCDTLVVQIGS